MSPPVADLEQLVWHEIPVTLRNVRNRYAREHPLWVLHGLVMFVVPRGPDGEPVRHWFRLREALPGDRIQKGRHYSFELVLPGADPTAAGAVAERLRAHLAIPRPGEPERNFELVSVDPPARCTLRDVLATAPPWPEGLDEVCLEFSTPLAYSPADRSRPWLLDGPGLAALLAGRLEKLFAVVLPAAPAGAATWAAAHTLPALWSYVSHTHSPKSQGGTQLLQGNAGPLYLRAAPPVLAAWRPWLLLGERLGAGRKLSAGGGRFALATDRPHFDPLLARPETYTATLEELRLRSDLPEGFPDELGDPDSATAALAESVGGGQWQPGAARGFRVPKSSGLGDRLVAQFRAPDRLVQQALHTLLAPVFDRLFEPQSHGYRLGHSVDTARRVVHEAWRAGYTLALESDIESFFDSVDWDCLAARLDTVLPRADRHTRAALHAALRTPVRLQGRPVPRTRGLLQGSPLSPLLANLFLDPFDEEMSRRGFQLVRYADDFLVLCRDEAEAGAALAAAQEILGGLKLGLKPAKTAITPFAQGLTFLGVQFGGGFDEALVSESALEKTVYLRHAHAWAGVDGDALVVRQGGRLLARLPFRRVRELVLLGAGGVSTRLVEQCARRDIPVSFCTAAGHLQNILWRHDQSHYARAAAHARRHAALSPAQHLASVRALVQAKLNNFRAWFLERPTAELRPVLETLDECADLLTDALTVDAVRGVEGLAARDVFRVLNDRAPAEFRSERREPGQGFDRWNSLLDFAYSLLFQRLNGLLRLRGLNPYLGLLHSARATYESLVCDLQEPFRARCDRFVLRLVNRAQITPADFAAGEAIGGITLAPRLTGPAAARFIELFARELDSQLAGEPTTWGKLLEAQVLCVQRWVELDEPLRFFHATPVGAVPPASP